MDSKRHFLWFLLLLILMVGCGTTLYGKEAGSVSESVSIDDTQAANASMELDGISDAYTSDPPPQFPSVDCPITQPQDPVFVPPDPYAPQAPYGNFWYGTNRLWTSLSPDGRWYALPQGANGYGQKVFWWREGYDMTKEQKPQITVIGRRLDGEAPVFEQTGGTNGYHADMGQFMLTGVAVPTSGCWEITGQYGEESLSFVVWVAP